MMSTASQTEPVVNAIRMIWREWSKGHMRFPGERPAMHDAFSQRLAELLPTGLSTTAEYRPRTLAPKLTAWSRYDIAVLGAAKLIALLELSLGDSNVPHALHNGELKLLGNCNGRGISGGGSYATARDLSREDVADVRSAIGEIPVRGLFFVNPGPREVLDRTDKAMWWETKGTGFKGETKFFSALLRPRRQATLRETLQVLSESGLWCWFYSLCGEEPLEMAPTEQVAQQS